MKKIYLYTFSIPLIFLLFLVFNTKKVSADTCKVDNISYQIPTQIAFKTYTLKIPDVAPIDPGIPSSFSSVNLIINIENEASCLSINDYKYSLSISKNSKLKTTNYTYSNILLDTFDGLNWSYSSNYHSFQTLPNSYNASYIKSPDISNKYYFYANVDNLVAIEDILKYIQAQDETDLDVTDSLTILEDNYTKNYHKLGEYSLIIEAKDQAMNSNKIAIIVKVVDIVKPKITGNDNLDSFLSNPLDLETILSFFTVNDNYDTDLTINVEEDNFTPNRLKKGLFTIKLTSQDSSLNKETLTVNINSIDDVAPLIVGSQEYLVGNGTNLDLKTILANLTFSDNIDDDLSNMINIEENNYSSNYNKVGNYKIILKVTDSSNNETSFTISIKVYDNIPPIFIVDENVILTDKDNLVSKEQIIELLRKTGQLQETELKNLTINMEEYSQNYDQKGQYNVFYHTKEENLLTIKVLESFNNKEKTNHKSSYLVSFTIILIFILIAIVLKKILTLHKFHKVLH